MIDLDAAIQFLNERLKAVNNAIERLEEVAAVKSPPANRIQVHEEQAALRERAKKQRKKRDPREKSTTQPHPSSPAEHER